jgi:hypothetical protein
VNRIVGGVVSEREFTAVGSADGMKDCVFVGRIEGSIEAGTEGKEDVFFTTEETAVG